MKLGLLIDEMYKVRGKYEAQLAKANEWEAKVKELEAQVIEALDAAGTSKGAGKNAQASLALKDVGRVEEWEKVWSWATANNAVDLFIKNVNQTAWNDRRKAGIGVPGVGHYIVKKLSLTKKK